jgi:hypothetical protein
MRIVLVTSIMGIAVWLVLMWLLGPIGIYVGFLTQMLLRSVGITIAARRYWDVRVSWDGVAAGILMNGLGLAIAGA